jgi:CBS domain-containing membrane protein
MPGMPFPLRQLLPYLVSDSTPLSGGEKLRSTLSAFLALLAVGLVSSQFLGGAGLPVMIASMGATAVILFATPHSPLAQPWPLVGGHLISAFVGVTCAKLVPEVWLAAALAVSLAILAMHLTRSLHPPGGASALLPVLGNNYVHADGYHFLLAPVGLNVLIIFAMALLVNNLLPGHRWPARPYPRKDKLHRHDDPTPLERLGIDKHDLHRALQDLDIYLDVSEEDLNLVYSRAGMGAFRRKMGRITCGDIMSRDVAAVEFGTDLEEVWAQLHFHKIKALPVIDRARRVIGIITLVDILKRADLKTYASFQDKLVKFIRHTPGPHSEKPEVAGQVMASPVVTAREDMHIVELVPLLSDRGLHHIPVVNGERRLVGMVTQSDLIAALYTGDVNR